MSLPNFLSVVELESILWLFTRVSLLRQTSLGHPVRNGMITEVMVYEAYLLNTPPP